MTQQQFTIHQLVLGEKTKNNKIETADINTTIASYITSNIINKASDIPSFKNDTQGAADAVVWMNANGKHKFSIDAVDCSTKPEQSSNTPAPEEVKS